MKTNITSNLGRRSRILFTLRTAVAAAIRAVNNKLNYLSRIAPATRLRRISAGAAVLSGLLFLVWCSPASAANPPTWVGNGLPAEKPANANSYVVTSDNKLLWDGAVNIQAGETNFPAAMNAFPSHIVDLVMQQCFGGGFAKGMQAEAINNPKTYTFTAATNWNETGLNAPGAPPPAVNNFTASWNQSYPRSEGLYTHYLDATNGAAAAPPHGVVTADPYGPMGALRNAARGWFENPSYASPDALVGGNPDPTAVNNARDIPTNQWAVLMAFQPDHARFGVNIDRIYNSLRTVGFGVPANHIIVLYGNNAANTTTAGGTPINGPVTVANVTTAVNNGAGLYGNITGQTPPGNPPNDAQLFVYTTGHGNSFTLKGGRRIDTVEANKFKGHVDRMPANDFLAPDGSPVDNTDTTSMVDLQISTRTQLVGSLSGTLVLVNGTSMGPLLDDNASPLTDLTDIIGPNFNYHVTVPAAFLNSFTPGSPVDIEIQNLNETVTDNLVAAITFNDYDNAWSVSMNVALPTSAVSRKTHGGAGAFDVNLPLTGNSGIECRSGGGTNDYQVVLTFASSVTFTSASVTAGTGSVSGSSGSGTTTATVNLTGVTNAQRITVTLQGVNGFGDVAVPMGVLVGDTTGNGTVSASDVSQTKLQSGQPATATNFREDISVNGTINASDVALVKARSGTALPPGF